MRHLSRLALSSLSALLVLVLGPVAPVHAQRVDPSRVIDVSMDLGTQVLSAAIREGGSFKLTLRDTDEYELVPVVIDPARRKVSFAVYHATVGQPATRRMVERIELVVGASGRFRTDSRLSMVVDRIRTVSRPEPAAAPARPISFRPDDVVRAAFGDPDQCCVCCGEACACACGVRMGCGSCCMSPDCCTVIKPVGAGPADALARFAAFFGTGCADGFSAPRGRTVVASR